MTRARTNPNPIILREQDGRKPSGLSFGARIQKICCYCQTKIHVSDSTLVKGLVACRDRDACAGRKSGGRA